LTVERRLVNENACPLIVTLCWRPKSTYIFAIRKARGRADFQCYSRPGWRRSADRTRLQPNSLLTGNFTGKIASFGFQKHRDVTNCRASGAFQAFSLPELSGKLIRETANFQESSRELGPNIRLDVQLLAKQQTSVWKPRAADLRQKQPKTHSQPPGNLLPQIRVVRCVVAAIP